MENTRLPRHVAIVMDGNGRWAKQRHLPRIAGHKVGVERVRDIVEACVQKKIEVLSVFAFSSENWQRPKTEISYLMELFIFSLQREAKKLHKQNVQLRIIGDCSRLDPKLQNQIKKSEQLTAHNTGLKFIIAINYGGQWDIACALQKIISEHAALDLANLAITPELIKSQLSTADLPDPDLFIRTSGEQRISNFMIWQLSYAELYFTSALWPDFNKTEFEQALNFYSTRERRFGLTGDQLQEQQHA